MSEKIIQDHEEWFKTTYPATYRDAKEGRDFDALCHFDHSQAGWQASRAALVVELPDYVGLGDKFTGTPIETIKAHNNFNKAVCLCRNAVHAVGVKTK